MSKLDNLLQTCGSRIIVVLLLCGDGDVCIYRVYCSDGGYTDYFGYDRLPQSLRDWLDARNSYRYTMPGCIAVSGVTLND